MKAVGVGDSEGRRKSSKLLFAAVAIVVAVVVAIGSAVAVAVVVGAAAEKGDEGTEATVPTSKKLAL